MPEEVKHCPLCGASTCQQFDLRQFRGYQVRNVICKHCGLVYQSPRMTESESQEFYETEYRLVYQGQQGPNTKDLSVQTNRAQVTLDFARQKVKTAARILDIGCSTGILLHQFMQHYHCDAYGVEPGKVYREYAQSTGLHVFPSLEELRQSDPAPFRLVSLMHVLEHLADPVEYLSSLRSGLLEPTGWLLLEVPNLYAHDCFEVAHQVSFSPHTLEQVLQKAGFMLVSLRKHGQPRSELIPLYISAIAQPAANLEFSLIPDHRVGINRRIGLFRRRLAERFAPQRAWLPAE
jgi:SAM-dependent methyltransferase